MKERRHMDVVIVIVAPNISQAAGAAAWAATQRGAGLRVVWWKGVGWV